MWCSWAPSSTPSSSGRPRRTPPGGQSGPAGAVARSLPIRWARRLEDLLRPRPSSENERRRGVPTMRVFLAGATGAVGRPLVRALVDRGHRVTATTRSAARLAALKAAGAEGVIVDGLDARQ